MRATARALARTADGGNSGKKQRGIFVAKQRQERRRIERLRRTGGVCCSIEGILQRVARSGASGVCRKRRNVRRMPCRIFLRRTLAHA